MADFKTAALAGQLSEALLTAKGFRKEGKKEEKWIERTKERYRRCRNGINNFPFNSNVQYSYTGVCVCVCVCNVCMYVCMCSV
jgi:hypothetical protein